MLKFKKTEPIMKRKITTIAFFACLLFFTLTCHSQALAATNPATTYPAISKNISPVAPLRITQHALAAIRKPPGPGPFPAIIFLHGGLGHTKIKALSNTAMVGTTQTRFLAWGYITVNATRRSNAHDPEDQGLIADTLAIINAVKAMPNVDPNSVVLYGGSGGGTLALEMAGVADLAAITAGEPATIIYMGMFNKTHINFDATGKVTGDKRWDVMDADPKSLYTPARRARTRQKIKTIHCPILILHGDQHPLKNFNFDIFIPELKSLNIDTTVKIYPGEDHGFYWGHSKNLANPLKANRDADAFFRKHIKTQPQPINPKHIKHVEIKDRKAR